MKECDVKLYALSTCVHCKNTKEFLDKCGVDYYCVHVDQLDAEQKKTILEEIKEVNPSCSFPTIVIGKEVIVGFREEKLKEVLDL
jgi:glutaredoxin-like protein NrdH